MSGAYPHFKPCYTHEELVEHFLLHAAIPSGRQAGPRYAVYFLFRC